MTLQTSLCRGTAAPLMTCSCGSQWWTLDGPDATTPPQVTLERDGTIGGYMGVARCGDCGRPAPTVG